MKIILADIHGIFPHNPTKYHIMTRINHNILINIMCRVILAPKERLTPFDLWTETIVFDRERISNLFDGSQDKIKTCNKDDKNE